MPIEHSLGRLVDAKFVREFVGGKSDMTIRRWMDSGYFPRPKAYINNIRHWEYADCAKWYEEQVARPTPDASTRHPERYIKSTDRNPSPDNQSPKLVDCDG